MTKKWWVLIGTGLSGLLIAIDYSIVNTSLANVQKALQASVNQLQWIMAGFGLTFCTFLVIAGRIGDLFGRRKALYIGMLGFTLSSFGAGWAHTAWQLILMRFLQGAFGATLFPCGMALTAAAFPIQEQGRALGIYGSLIGVGLAIGPVLGGVLTHFLSWRWIFFINIPVMMTSFFICILFIKESRINGEITLDWRGLILLIISLATLILAISQGLEWGWISLPIVTLFTISIICFILFALVENKTPMPLIPFHLMKNNHFYIGNLIFIVSCSFNWAIIFLVPLYLQNVQDYSALVTGLLLLPMTGMTAVMPGIAGHWLDKKGITFVTYAQFFISLVAFILLITLSTNSSMWWMIFVFLIVGVGWGIGNGIGMPIALSGLKNRENIGLVSGATTTILNIFGVLVLSISTTIFRFNESKSLVHTLRQHRILLSSQQLSIIKTFLSDPQQAMALLDSFNKQFAHHILLFFHQAFIEGFRIAIYALLTATSLAFIVVIIALRSIKVNVTEKM